MWRATDPALARPVGVRLLALDDPRSETLASAATQAAAAHDRRLVSVLDVIRTEAHVAVVTEWAPGRPWSELLTEPWGPQDSLIVAYEVARALQAAHRAGVAHGRVRPSSVIITDSNHVRLRGLGVEGALWGVAPVSDPFGADIFSVGAVLFAGLTRKWPVVDGNDVTVDGLPLARPPRGSSLFPSDVMADVPEELDAVVGRCLAVGSVESDRSFSSMDAVVDALAGCLLPGNRDLEEDTNRASANDQTDRVVRRGAGVLLTVLSVMALGVIGLNVADRIGDAPRAQSAGGVAQGAVAVAPERETDPRFAARTITPIPILSITDFDPEGEDRQENPDLVPLAIDGDDDTAWETVTYRSSGMDPKTGVGLKLDLGAPRSVRGISLLLRGATTDLTIYTSRRDGQSVAEFSPFASVVAGGEKVLLRKPQPVTARYVVVWLTNLPYAGQGYRGGVRDVKVLG